MARWGEYDWLAEWSEMPEQNTQKAAIVVIVVCWSLTGL